jgi:hypothetical protein
MNAMTQISEIQINFILIMYIEPPFSAWFKVAVIECSC